MSAPTLFLADLDGTLLNSEKKVTEKTKKALAEFTAHGNYFAISTGRPWLNTRRILKGLELPEDRAFAACFNGAEVYASTGERIFQAGVDVQVAREILAIGREEGVYIHTYDSYGILSDQDTKELAYYMQHTPLPAHVVKDAGRAVMDPPAKLIAVELEDFEKLEKLRERLEHDYAGILKIRRSEKTLLEIFSCKAGKDRALLALCEHLHLDPKQTVAAGDAENDTDMIRAAGVGIVMCNGQEEVKRVADVVTARDNDHDGLVEYLAGGCIFH
ncbi:MAG: Cof-type HAD-IIB family hydrolase [Lachnospiraceae bacterium]|nr:Cof-type HAD-IIB family hydrolase [Lachnospiraceae bacterium]